METKQPLIIPKGRNKGYYLEQMGDDYICEIIRNPKAWLEYPEVIERARELRPDFAANYKPPEPPQSFTHESIMPFGKWRGHKLGNVPADYLLSGFDNPVQSGFSQALLRYIDSNRIYLLAGAENYKPRRADITPPPATVVCTKRAFTSKDEARKALKKIRAEGSRDPDGKIPDRSYECPHCSFWHLTSKPHNDWT